MFSQIVPATPVHHKLTVIGVNETTDSYELFHDTEGLDDNFFIAKTLFPNATKIKPPFRIHCEAVGKQIVSF